MQTLKSIWTSANPIQKTSIVILTLAALVALVFAFTIPKVGLTLLILLGCFTVAGAFATLIVYPIKRK